jgi:hypothetical protein
MSIEPGRCRRCGILQNPDDWRSDLCPSCRAVQGFRNAAPNTFGLLDKRILPVAGGFRLARWLDQDFFNWMCPHVHPDPDAAISCPDREPLCG